MRYLNRLGIDFEALLKIASLLGFAFLFYKVIESGNAKYYVHPRIIPYMQFGIVMFITIALFISGELFKTKRKNIKLGRYLLFIIPLMLAFALPPKALDTDTMSISNINTMGRSYESSGDGELVEDTQTYSDREENNIATGSGSNQNAGKSSDNISKELLKQGDTIVMAAESFIPWIEELYGSLSKYEGKKIQVVGFVFKDKEFGQNRFVPARFTMNCCAADMQPVGLLCNYQRAEQLKKDSWVKVTGKIQKGEFKGEIMPVIAAETVEPTDKPEDELVY
ncbi:MAG TPA: TIGR03943 family protein [Pseudobacteroides sp.]|uniref:TIGR03943 family putative permease subunit n=1 Tax=Pseudobacteroides sp. TaxID=1968840 RepID=UPI002F95841A